MKIDNKLFIIVALFIMQFLLCPGSGYSLAALPDIGINHQTMKVTQAAKLTAAGMKNVNNGDTISVRASQEGKILIKNIRTGEELIYPPVKQKGK